MAQQSMRSLNSGPSPHKLAPSGSLTDRVDDAKKVLILTLKETNWPQEASNDAQALIQTMEAPLDLDKIPKDEMQISVEVKGLLKLLLRELETAHARVKAESEKYGTNKKWFKKQAKKLFSRADGSQCNEVLRSCRTDVEASTTALNNLLNHLNIGTEQLTLQVVESETEHDTATLPSAQAQQAAVTLGLKAGSGPITTLAQSSSSPSQVGHAATAQADKQDSLNNANKALKLAEGISGALPVVGTFVGAIAKVGLTVVEMVQAMDSNDETAKGLRSHVGRLSKVLERFSDQALEPEKSQITNGMEVLQRELRDIEQEIEKLKSQANVKKFWHSSDHSGSLKNLQEKIHAALEEIHLIVNLNTSMLATELHNESLQNKHRYLLNCLGDGKYGTRGNAIEDIICLAGTRVKILERIDNWIRGESNSERVLCIQGMAGRGKSTIASTMVHKWKGRACCAIYHFRRGQSISNASLVCGLARQLARSINPELRNAILSAVEKNEDIMNERLDEQFAALFVASLGSLKNKAPLILIVVDALDECDPVEDAVKFVELIGNHSDLLPTNLKFLLTTRPEAPLLLALNNLEGCIESLDLAEDVNADIDWFLTYGLLQVKAKHKIEGEWPAPTDLSKLVKMSQGLFQWARTVVKYVDNGSPMDQLAELLESPKVWSGVDELYTQILARALERVKQNSARRKLLLNVLGALVVAPYPVSLEVIAALHSEHDLIKGKTPEMAFNLLRQGILADLNSLLFVPVSSSEPILLVHTSVRDLLVDPERCGGHPYWVDISQNHQRLVASCIRQMNQALKENICNLTDLSKPGSGVPDIVGREVSKAIHYCCRSWSIHLTKGQQALRPDGESESTLERDFELFSEKKILSWLEIMSLLGICNEGVIMAKEVHQWLSHHTEGTPGSNSLVMLWNDVHRFATAFSEPIAFNPLHIYVSALAHCPVKTELWKHYGSRAKARTIRSVQPPTWSPDLWAKSVGSHIYSVAFSPDRALLASGGADTMIHLLDPNTGGQVGKPLTGQSGTIWSICFSPDGKLLASGSGDTTIRIWDPQTCRQVGEPLAGHSGSVYSVCFSPDSNLLASGSSDQTVRLWDPQTGRQVGEPLAGHSGSVYSVCFKLDGKLLASGSDDGSIRLWDPQTTSPVGDPLTGHSNTVRSVCFSPDGKLLASGSWDNTIRLWDSETTGQVGKLLIGCSSAVLSVCFSPDGKLLAPGSWDTKIQLWDPQTGMQVGEPLRGHHGSVHSVCFSPDGKHLASGSWDNTIRLWDPQTGTHANESLTGHSGTVYSICFSPDGNILASGSYDETIRLWDPQTGMQVGKPLRGHHGTIHSICFSPDSKLLASGSSDATICLWELQTGTQVSEPLAGHSAPVWSVCFSPNGKLLASGSEDKTIRLWDPQTGTQVGQPLTGYDFGIKSVWFSSCGVFLTGHDGIQDSLACDVLTREQADVPSCVPSLEAAHFRDQWVTFSSSRLFWLPSQYWGLSLSSCVVTFCAGKLAVAHGKTISVFDISDALSLYHHPLFYSPSFPVSLGLQIR